MFDNPEAGVRSVGEAAPGGNALLRPQLLDLLERRRSVAPLRLSEPGPTSEELRRMLTIATRVPDHGALEPWRIVLVQGRAREELGNRLAAAFLESNADEVTATEDLAVRKIKAVFTAAPLILIVVSCADSSARVPEWEQVLYSGAVCMNLMTAASALGYGSTWLSGWAAYHPAASRLLGLQSHEKVAGVIPIGTIVELPEDRVRPSVEKIVTLWGAK